MPVGFFDKQGNACLKFHLCGVVHQEPGLEFQGIIDTGFTGFIQLPIQHAFSLKLPLDGTVTVTLADGSSTVCLTVLAKTTFDGETQLGVVSLEAGSQDVLIGMDFLRKFRKSVIITKNEVILLEEDWLDKVRATAAAPSTPEAAVEKDAQAPAGSSSTGEPLASSDPSVSSDK